LLERDPARAAPAIDYVRSLTGVAMAEMRALIFDLRPESLELEGLVGGLRQQAQAVAARYDIPVDTSLGDEPAVPLPVKEAVYRIAQEAMHNAVKHAAPHRLEVCLCCKEDALVLDVCDDGLGFDTTGAFPGHLGLHTMRERATRLGGTLEIASAAGAGTRVQVHIPLPVRAALTPGTDG
jgi:signal transduction histidine kinase